ncbi:hypothetical protein GOP47_0027183 [Adiantum capillus-veneris]|nr:hypothetical protein GOP47_0027183 [Adiantum capillus-veneris]
MSKGMLRVALPGVTDAPIGSRNDGHGGFGVVEEVPCCVSVWRLSLRGGALPILVLLFGINLALLIFGQGGWRLPLLPSEGNEVRQGDMRRCSWWLLGAVGDSVLVYWCFVWLGYAGVAGLHFPDGFIDLPIEGARLSSKVWGGCVVFGLDVLSSTNLLRW